MLRPSPPLESHNRSPCLNVRLLQVNSAGEALTKTLGLIGKAIEDGSRYHPIRAHAAGLATRAGPKDYLGQAQSIYNDFVSRWRYVHDPATTEAVTTSGDAIWSQTMGAHARPGEKGYGDCDDATVALGAQFMAVGFPVLLKTIAPPRSKKLFTHILPVVKIPKLGWMDVDAVGFPKHQFGWTAPASRSALWTLKGKLVSAQGSFPQSFKRMQQSLSGLDNHNTGGIDMYKDYGLENYGLAGTGGGDSLHNWNEYGLAGFGAYAGQLGILDGDQYGFLMEYDEDDELGKTGLVRTKMLEICPRELRRIRRTGRPRRGLVALGDDGDVYQWDHLGGFFKKIFKKAKGAVVKVAKKVHKGVVKVTKKLISKLPGGKYLIKLYDKVHKTAMKLVRPLMKVVGKFAKKLAPIAAMIPGYGPAIAGALYTAGTIANILKKSGIVTDSTGKPKFKSGDQAKKFKKMLEKAAEKEKRRDAKIRKQKAMLKKRKRRVKKVKGRLVKVKGRLDKRDATIARLRARLLKQGTPEHEAVMRGYGLDLDVD